MSEDVKVWTKIDEGAKTAECKFSSAGVVKGINGPDGKALRIPQTYVIGTFDFSKCSQVALHTLAAAQCKILESGTIKTALAKSGTVIYVEEEIEGKMVEVPEWEVSPSETEFLFEITDAYVFDKTKRGASPEEKRQKAMEDASPEELRAALEKKLAALGRN